jgi:GT2 family glycosyltransferase
LSPEQRDAQPRYALSVVVVTYDSSAQVRRSLPAIAAELGVGDELIVCDNGSSDDTARSVRELVPEAELLELGANLGFGAACNAGAERARGELLLFLNPDAVVEPGFREAIELPLRESRGWDAWQGLVGAGGGRANSWGGVVHFTGVAWAGGAGEPLERAPRRPVEVSFASGACLAVRREAWAELGGFSPELFLYHEDTDLGLRLWLSGRRVGLEPRARCLHDYEFGKGSQKWYYLERNRYATIVRTYPRRVLVAVLPALVATELAVLAAAVLGGWIGPKLRADRDFLRALSRLRRERAAITGPAAIGPSRFAELLSAELDSAYLGAPARSPLLRALLRAYWRIARLLIG